MLALVHKFIDETPLSSESAFCTVKIFKLL